MGYASIFLVILFIGIACPIAAMHGLRRSRSKRRISN
jgi:hypothetical protein